MFALRVHSLDADHSLVGGLPPSPSLCVAERRGFVHLFRSDPTPPSRPNPSSEPPLLFVAAVPNYFSPDEFLNFCVPYLDRASQILILRNDGMEDRYSVLIKLVDQASADAFYCDFNGKRFSPSEVEVCHILFTVSVEYTEVAEIAGTPPPGFTELPTCPVCLERLDQDTSGILSTVCDHSFQCSCVSKWTYLSCQVCRLCQQQDERLACSVCETSENLWACVICGFVGCGRYKEGHAIRHWKDTQHCYSMELETQQIWDYVGDSYVHRLNHSKADGKPVTTNSHCISLKEDCGTCGCSEDSGISGALYSSKVEAIAVEYNHLLATQLKTQRQYYESLLLEARVRKESSISEAVAKAVTTQLQDVHHKLEKCIEQKKQVADLNQNLIKNQELWQIKVKETEEREMSSLRWRDEKIMDLQEQIRDLRVYVEAQKTLDTMADLKDVRGGTLLPVPLTQSTPVSAKRNLKSSRRRN